MHSFCLPGRKWVQETRKGNMDIFSGLQKFLCRCKKLMSKWPQYCLIGDNKCNPMLIAKNQSFVRNVDVMERKDWWNSVNLSFLIPFFS
jgi:hypothetical protein